jgi:hypothetical protein
MLHDIALPHTAIWIVETVQHLHFDVLEHPPYSPDVVPFDSPFGFSQRCFQRPPVCQWQSSEGFVTCMACQLAKTIFCQGIQKLVYHWTEYIEKQMDYVMFLLIFCCCWIHFKKYIVILPDSLTQSLLIVRILQNA